MQNVLEPQSHSRTAPAGAPGRVIAAGTSWVLCGGLHLLGAGLLTLINLPLLWGFQSDWDFTLVVALLLSWPLVAGIGLVAVGNATTQGRTRDTLGNGIGSLLLGLLYLAGGGLDL